MLFSPLVHTVGLLISKIISCSIATYLLYQSLLASSDSQKKTRQLWFLATFIFFSHAFVHFSWILKLIDKLLYPITFNLFSLTTLFTIRLAEIVIALSGFAFILFLEQFSNNKFTLTLRHKALTVAILFFSCCMAIIAVACFKQTTYGVFETAIRQLMVWYMLISTTISALVTWKQTTSPHLPRILQQQCKHFFAYIVPHLCLNFIGNFPLLFATIPMPMSMSTKWYPFIMFSDIFSLTFMLFCIRNILRLRFLNTHQYVQAAITNYKFTKQLKEILSHLCRARSTHDLEHITRLLFSRIFKINPTDVTLYVRPRPEAPDTGYKRTLPAMEAWLATTDHENLHTYLTETRDVLIRDELAFDYFYEGNPRQQQFLDLLDSVGADVVIPVYEEQSIVAYILIKKNARPAQLFSNVERDEMSIFATHLSILVYSLQHRSFSEIVRKERASHEKAYNKQQTITHCKESFKTLLSTTGHCTTGVLQYQRRKLIWASETARRLFNIDKAAPLETISQAPELKRIAHDALSNNREREAIIHISESQIVHCKIMPSPDTSQSIILAYEPNAADNFVIPFDRLNDMNSWEYALLLETTASGKLINQLIPSSGKEFLNFKIELLKLSLSKKPTLILVPEDDLRSIVHIIHHISLRTQLEIMHLTQPEQGSEIGIQLFGIIPLSEHDVHDGLLGKLHKTGTLFIQNIQFLSKETQERLAACISTGLYQPLKTNTWQPCDIRIICSTSQPLETLSEENLFSRAFSDMLRTTTLTLPPLSQIPRDELCELIRTISEQIVQSKELRSALEFTAKETEAILENASPSIQGFKEQVYRTLRAKSQRKHIDHLVRLEPLDTAEFSPAVTHALRQGKKALKDRRLMDLLWRTFENQAKIAALLDVNRSSVNRRLKDYKLVD